MSDPDGPGAAKPGGWPPSGDSPKPHGDKQGGAARGRTVTPAGQEGKSERSDG
jgi:hypothetical protein